MSAKHTPGPWVAHPIELMTAGLPYTPVAANTLIAKVYSTAYGDHEQSQANARLMAAAPELLQALRDLLEAAGSIQGTFGCIRGDTPEDADLHIHDEWAEGFLKERADQAIAVLAKMEGQQ